MKIDRSLFFFITICFFSIAMCSIFYGQLGLFFTDGEESGLKARLFFFDRFVVENITISLLGIWLLRFKLRWRLTFYGLFFLFCCATTIQIYSFYMGGEYVTRLAVENINHISLLITSKRVVVILLAVLVFLSFVFLSEFCCGIGLAKPALFTVSIILVLSSILLSNSAKWLPRDIHVGRMQLAKANFIEYTAPVFSFYQTFWGKGKSDIQKDFSGLLPSEKYFLAKHDYAFDQDAQFPLMKDVIYQGPLTIGDVQRTTQPNIIVFFTEGFATNLTNAYVADLPMITPNLLDFSETSMRVDNYYGHTWATYRGLLGQLCSIYPFYGGYGGWHTYYDKIVKPPYNCVNGVLKSEGYHTIFLDSHIHDKAYIDEMMGHLGFDEILTGDQLSSRYLSNEKPLVKDSISDKQFYRSFTKYLKTKEMGQDKPFFIGIYTLGTHAFRSIAKDGIEFGDGSNNVLNRIYSLDDAFGVFWSYFKESALADNTIVIFSSDHAPYMEKPYVEALNAIGRTKPKPSFWDTIPLIIYDPTRELPKSYNAKAKTSIDFTPSLLHYLGVDNRTNSFIGESIFETDQYRKRKYGVICAEHLMIIDGDGSYYTLKDAKHLESTVKLFDKYVDGVKHFEMKRRIWPEDLPQ
jgi:hypothetical protein